MTQHHKTAGYIKAAREARRIFRSELAAGAELRCVDCGRPIHPEQRWDVGHIVPASKGGSDELNNLGPSHTTCNRRAGGRLGASATNRASRRARRLPTGWS